MFRVYSWSFMIARLLPFVCWMRVHNVAAYNTADEDRVAGIAFETGNFLELIGTQQHEGLDSFHKDSLRGKKICSDDWADFWALSDRQGGMGMGCTQISWASVDGASEGLLSGGPLRKWANKELLMASFLKGHGRRNFVEQVDVALQVHEECRGSGNMWETSQSAQAGNFALQETGSSWKKVDTLQSAPAGDFESVQAGDLASDVPAECGLGGTTGRIGGREACTPGPSGSMETRGRGEITSPVLSKIRARSASAQFPGCNWSRNSRGEIFKGLPGDLASQELKTLQLVQAGDFGDFALQKLETSQSVQAGDPALQVSKTLQSVQAGDFALQNKTADGTTVVHEGMIKPTPYRGVPPPRPASSGIAHILLRGLQKGHPPECRAAPPTLPASLWTKPLVTTSSWRLTVARTRRCTLSPHRTPQPCHAC